MSIFVSHASDDKELFVRPLAHALKSHGLKVWYDEFSLRPGDSLRRSIDRGLAECEAGLVVLSPAFFSKEWPQRELDALLTAEIAGRSRIIPVWYQIGFDSVAAISPLLADRFAIRGEVGVNAIASKVAEQFRVPAKLSGAQLGEVIEGYQAFGLYAGEATYRGCQYRFLKLQAFKEEYCDIHESAISHLSDDEIENFPSALDAQLRREAEILRRKYRIPEDVYVTTDEPEDDVNLGWWMDEIGEWVSGTLSSEESAKLVYELDLIEVDEYYILLDVPNFSISSEQRPLVQKALIEIGCGFTDGYTKLLPICEKLRALDIDG